MKPAFCVRKDVQELSSSVMPGVVPRTDSHSTTNMPDFDCWEPATAGGATSKAGGTPSRKAFSLDWTVGCPAKSQFNTLPDAERAGAGAAANEVSGSVTPEETSRRTATPTQSLCSLGSSSCPCKSCGKIGFAYFSLVYHLAGFS